MKKRPQRQRAGRTAPRLPPGARWAVRGLAAVPLLSLSVASGCYFVSVYHLLRAHLVPIAEAELTRQLGHEVRIGGADFSTSGKLVLTKIAVSNRATFAAGHGEAALTAPRLTIGYNLHDLVFDSGNAAHALGDITVDRPFVLVERLTTTRFNFSDILKPKTTGAKKPFVGRVLVHNGTLRFRDYLAPANVGSRPAINALTNLDATVDFGSTRNVYFGVRGRGAEGRVASLAVDGSASREVAGRFTGQVSVRDADAAYWTDYFKAVPQGRITAGRVDADVHLAKLTSKPAPGLPLDFSGSASVRGGAAAFYDPKLRRVTVRALTGTAAFTDVGITFDARVQVAGQPLAAAGSVFDFQKPRAALTVSARGLDPERLARLVPGVSLPQGLSVAPGASLTAQVTGLLTNPSITASASLPLATFAGNRLTQIAVRGVYANKVLVIPAASLRVNGTGQAAFRATVDSRGAKPALLASGSVSGINLAALKLPPSVKLPPHLNLGGVVGAQFVAESRGGPLSVTANVNAIRPQFRQTALRSLDARVAWTAGRAVTLTGLVARDASGTAAVSGTVPAGPDGQWNLTVRTAGLDLGRLLRPYSALPLSGRAAFDGRVTGPTNTPVLTGSVRLVEPRFERYSADLVTAQIRASPTALRLQNATVRRFPAEVGISGVVTNLASGNPDLNLTVHLSQGDVADFLKLAESASAPSPKTTQKLAASLPNLTGTAQGTFAIRGRVKSPVVSGHAEVADATVGDYRLDRVAADLSYRGGTLRLENGRVKSGQATITASGSRTDAGALQAEFAASGVELTRFRALTDSYALVRGTASVSGRFSGTAQQPHLVIDALNVPDLIVDRQRFAPISLAARFDDGVLTQTNGPWRFVVDVPTDYAAEVGGQVEYDVNALKLVVPGPNRAGSVALSAAIPEAAPERVAHVLKTIRESRFAQTDAGKKLLASVAALPQPVEGTFALPRVTVEGPLTRPQVRAELTASKLVLGETKIDGLTASIGMTGGADPAGTLTASAQKLLAGGIAVGTASADVDYANRVVTVHSLRAKSDRAFLNASGRADLDGDLTASVDASSIPLALLGTVLPSARAGLRVLPREISTLSVEASGPTRSPNLVGSITLSNPEGAAPAGAADTPAFALDRVRSGRITLDSQVPGGPKTLTVSDLVAFKNGRLVATLSGSLPVPLKAAVVGSLPLPDQDLRAVLNVQDLSALAGFAPGLLDPKRTGGGLTATASVVGGQLSGLITVKDASVGVSGFETGISKLGAIVVLADSKATIQTLKGQSTKGGTFALSGSAALTGADPAVPPQLNLRLTATDLKFDETDRRSLLVSQFGSGARAKINGVVTMAGPLLTPKIATPPGRPIVVSDAVATLPGAATGATTGGGTPSFNPTLAVAVQVGSGPKGTATVQGPLGLRAEARGLVLVSRTLASPHLGAKLAVTRGQFILPPSTLLKIVKPGLGEDNTVEVSYPVIGPDGLTTLETRVNLTAQARVTVSPAALTQYRSASTIGESASQPVSFGGDNSFGSGDRQRYTITVKISGILNSPDKLNLELSSSPGGLTRTQMLAALVPAGTLLAAAQAGGQNGANVLENQFKSLLTNVALPTLLTPITDSVASALGLEEVGVTYDPNQPLFVTVTKQLFPRLDVTFSRSFGAGRGTVGSTTLPPQFRLKLGYLLSNKIRLGLSTTDRQDNGITVEGFTKF